MSGNRQGMLTKDPKGNLNTLLIVTLAHLLDSSSGTRFDFFLFLGLITPVIISVMGIS